MLDWMKHKQRTNESEIAQSCLALCNPMDCSLPGSSIHRILEARVLKWVAISFSPGIEPVSPTLQADALLSESPRKPRTNEIGIISMSVLARKQNKKTVPNPFEKKVFFQFIHHIEKCLLWFIICDIFNIKMFNVALIFFN